MINPQNQHQNVEYAVGKINTNMVLFDKRVLEKIRSYADVNGTRKEVGGLLLGYRKGMHLHVVKVTLPGKKDVSQRYRFIRQDASHQIIALKHWLISGKKIGWIGEWHTHPELSPVPSTTDISSWENMVLNNQAQMTFVILGTESLWIGIMHPSRHLQILSLQEESEQGFLFA